MQSLRQLGIGIGIAVLSVILVVGGIMLSLAETLPPASTPTQISATLPLEFPTPTETASPLPSETSTETATNTPTETSLAAAPTQCIPPAGWIRILTTAGDTIYSIAERYKTTADSLSAANCLQSADFPAGFALYVPPVPTVTVIACGPPFGWVRNYIVQRGDTLFRIAQSYGISYPSLQRANCMGSSTIIYAGQRLWVPNVPTRTPIPGITVAPDTPTSTDTSIPIPTTEEPTQTPEPTAAATDVPTSTPPATPTSETQ